MNGKLLSIFLGVIFSVEAFIGVQVWLMRQDVTTNATRIQAIKERGIPPPEVKQRLLDIDKDIEEIKKDLKEHISGN